jgi:HAD superfamily hydrolase (TIGR01490 family)
MSSVCAFFDLDRTLVSCNTGRLFLKDLRKRGDISLARVVRALGWLVKYHFSLLDIEAIARNILAGMRGHDEGDFAEKCRRLVEGAVLPRLQAEGLNKIAEHRAKGHRVAILSTSPSYIARPVAEKLGMDFVLSTRLEVKDGRFTGELDGPACYGKGKVHWAEDLGNKLSLDLDNCWFYTDSYTDLPMLERVGHRVIVNPDPRLRRTARRRGWSVETWAEAAA